MQVSSIFLNFNSFEIYETKNGYKSSNTLEVRTRGGYVPRKVLHVGQRSKTPINIKANPYYLPDSPIQCLKIMLFYIMQGLAML